METLSFIIHIVYFHTSILDCIEFHCTYLLNFGINNYLKIYRNFYLVFNLNFIVISNMLFLYIIFSQINSIFIYVNVLYMQIILYNFRVQII